MGSWGLFYVRKKNGYIGKANMDTMDILHGVQNYVSDIPLTVKLLPILVKQNRINTTVGNDPFFFSEQYCKCSHRFCPVIIKDRLL